MTTKEQMRGTPVPQRATKALDTPQVSPATLESIEHTEAEDAADAAAGHGLPQSVTELPDGTWIFELQYPLEPAKDSDLDPEKLRLPPQVYARHVRDADRNGQGMVDTMLYLAAGMTGTPYRTLCRLDHRDYTVLSQLLARRTAVDPT